MSVTLGEGSKRYEDTWVFRRAEFRMVKEQQTNIFQAVKLNEGQYEQRVIQRHSGAGFQGS